MLFKFSKMLFLLLLGIPTAQADGMSPADCLKQAALKEAAYPSSVDELSARCQSGTSACQKTWSALMKAKARLQSDYQALCSHPPSAPSEACDTNCLGNAALTTRQALADTSAIHGDVVLVQSAVAEARKQNLLYARQRIYGFTTAAPWFGRQRKDALFLPGSWLWAAAAWADGGSYSPTTGCVRCGATQADHPSQAADGAGNGAGGSTVTPSAPEQSGYSLAVSGKSIPAELYTQMRARDVAENLQAAAEAQNALKELGAREQKLAQDQKALGTQLAQLQTLRSEMASSPVGDFAIPSESVLPISGDTTPSRHSAPAAPSGGLTGLTSDVDLSAGTAVPSRNLRERQLETNRTTSATQAQNTAPAGGAIRNASLITKGPDGNLAGTRGVAGVAVKAASGENPPIAAPAKGSRLRDRLRQLLAQREALEETSDADGNLPVRSAAEGALASVLHGNSQIATRGEDSITAPPEFIGLTGDRYLGHQDEFDEQSGALDRDSSDLFTRVHRAHRRFDKAGHLETADL